MQIKKYLNSYIKKANDKIIIVKLINYNYNINQY